jgi:hypothetical protein
MICGTEACKLGAMIHGAELRVHFLKSFQKGSTCENLSQKGLICKKVGGVSPAAASAEAAAEEGGGVEEGESVGRPGVWVRGGGQRWRLGCSIPRIAQRGRGCCIL